MSESFDYNAPTKPQARGGYEALDPDGTQRIAPPPGPPSAGRPGDRSKALDWTLKGLGLLLVAVLSGLVWWLFHQGSGPTEKPPGSAVAGAYQFTPYHQPVNDSTCAPHATGQLRQYLVSHSCQQLSRSLYTTQLSDGRQVLVGVAVLHMGNTAAATGLDTLSNTSDTGHVKDLVEDKTAAAPNGPTNLENGGYASAASGTDEVIAVTELFASSQNGNAKAALNAVASAAVRQLGSAS
ncbi:MAG TPA: hypothetical protein VG317_05775 [Pseudonocardiaceae bacterium]|jgi:hypothetical protein|nr:hypothetical protein [Pseudonocardiaceae bacterium]